MFERLEVLSGDLETGIWLIDKGSISFSGGFSISRSVKFAELESISRKEQIKNDVYIEIKLISGELANAKLDLKHYSKLYDGFVSAKKIMVTPKSSIETVKDQKNANVIWQPQSNDKANNKFLNWGGFIFIIVMLYAFSSTPSNTNKVNSTQEINNSQRNLQHEREAKAIVQSAGYKCDSVDKMLTGFDITLSCNGYQYLYDIEDVGGRWKVTPQ
jgi:hypothetical protein